jgi:tellurite resistance protein TerC
MTDPVFWLWTAFFILIAALLALDLFVFHRHAHQISLREASGWTLFWIVIGLAFGGVVYAIYEHHWLGATFDQRSVGGTQALVEYLTAYILEKSLSIDNIFVIAVIFSSFRVPPAYQHRVLFWGIFGAVAARAVIISSGLWLVSQFTWMFYLFGAFLVFTGLRMLLSSEDENEGAGRVVELARKYLPVAAQAHGSRFLVRENGRLVITYLALTLIAIELADLAFAVDSVPAVLAVSTEPFVVVTSNVFAILGLRSLYFVLADILRRFHYLQHALALLLIIIGAKMLLHSVMDIPSLLALVLVVAVVGAGIGVSLLIAPGDEQDA